jgi:hypothetical protein
MTDLHTIYNKHRGPEGGGDKGIHGYIPTYQHELNNTDNIALLEIGVFQGHSIAMWNEYFTNSTIHGIDITLHQLAYPLTNVYLCNALDPHQLNQTLHAQTYDYIIDDGSHLNADIITAFNNLYHRLNPGGKYFIEDIQIGQLAELNQAFKHHHVDIIDTRRPGGPEADIMLIIRKPATTN